MFYVRCVYGEVCLFFCMLFYLLLLDKSRYHVLIHLTVSLSVNCNHHEHIGQVAGISALAAVCGGRNLVDVLTSMSLLLSVRCCW